MCCGISALDSVRYVAEPKLDGLAVSLFMRTVFWYEVRRVVMGNVGEDVTAQIRTIRAVPCG